ncbi:MAG: hypothetical protein IJL86_06285 [Bacteroidales bacterium]|nr:hypothetical protein [Bacteroidales bacterium]
MKKSILMLCAAGALTLSCAKEGFELSPRTGRLEILGTDTKALLTDGYQISWESGKDKVCFFNKSTKYEYTAASSGITAWLEGPALPSISGYFYALYPYDEQATNSTGIVTTTLPALQKAIPDQFSNIVAVGSTKGETISFFNCVTLVEVELATDGVKEISFRGNNGETLAGKLRMTIPTKSGEPDPTIVDEGEKEVSVSDGGAVLKKGKYYLAIAPQPFSKGVTITLRGDGGVAEKVTTKPVTARRSRRLSAGSIDLKLVPEDAGFSFTWDDGAESGTIYAGQSKTLVYSYSGIKSFRYSISGGPVSVEYQADDSRTPASYEGRFSRDISEAYREVELLPAPERGGQGDNVLRLRAAGFRGSEADPVNLTTDNNRFSGLGGSNTANCYIVTSPGIYAFPLVWGNALKGGIDNPEAYAPSASGSTMLSPFVDASGNAITKPYINADGARAVSARLEWEDAPGLIDEVHLNASGTSSDRISFRVPAETIREGNALISALDADGEVVWSWHIWVCGAASEDLSPVTVTNKASLKYKMLPVHIGWVAPAADGITYAPRQTKVRLTQNATGKVIELTFIQTGATLPVNETGYCPFYQWGRKDPFVAGDGSTEADAAGNGIKKVWYNASRRDTIGTRAAQLGSVIANFIKHPTHYNVNSNGDAKYSNIWNATQPDWKATTGVVKTIYDPSPVGFCVPPVGVWSACTKDNVEGDFSLGYSFYAAPGKTGKTMWYPAIGSMSTSNLSSTKVYAALRNVGTGFSVWSANPNGANSAYYFSCSGSGSSVSNTYGANRQYVYPVRPMLEQQ